MTFCFLKQDSSSYANYGDSLISQQQSRTVSHITGITWNELTETAKIHIYVIHEN